MRLVRIWPENEESERPLHSGRHARTPGPDSDPGTALSIRSAERRRWSAELTGPDVKGLVIHGIGGIGKSTLAGQITARISRLQPWRVITVIKGEIRAPDVAGRMADNGLLVLDDFDDNLSAESGGQTIRDPALAALLTGRSGILLITCRQRFSWPEPAGKRLEPDGKRLEFRHLGPLTRTSAAELAMSLPALRLAADAERDRVWRLTAGHPRTVEYLNSLLAYGDARFLDVADRIAVAAQVRTGRPLPGAQPTELPEATAETIALAAGEQLLGELFDRLSPSAKALLVRASVFRTPVGPAVLAADPAEITECLAAGLLTASRAGSGGELSVHRWTAGQLHHLLAEARQDGLVADAHSLAARHWQPLAGSAPDGQRAQLEASYHLERARYAARRPRPLVSRLASLAGLAGAATAATVLLSASAADAPAVTPQTVTQAVRPVAQTVTQAAAVRGQAAAWVAGQVGAGAVIACDPAMCSALVEDGIAAGSLLVLRPGAVDPLGADVVVATAAVRGMFGSRLASVYAPEVIASFGDDGDSGDGAVRIDVRAVAPDGAAAYRLALAADLRARRLAGSELLGNARVTLPPAARTELVAGQVDARVLVTLAALAASEPVAVVGFGGDAPGASPDMPLRTAGISVPNAAVGDTLAFVRAQRPPYLPVRVTIGRRTAGRTVLSIEFAAPSPVGLLQTQPLTM